MDRDKFHRFFILLTVFTLFLPSVIDNWHDGIIIVGSCIFTAFAVYPSSK